MDRRLWRGDQVGLVAGPHDLGGYVRGRRTQLAALVGEQRGEGRIDWHCE